jgi:hypothetical protein
MEQFSGMLRRLFEMLVTTSPTEITCDECFKQVAGYAERLTSRSGAVGLYQEVEQHLGQCVDCREEFEALLGVLRWFL